MDFVAARNDSRKRSLSELNGKLYNSKDLSNRETKTLLHFVFNHTKLVLPLDREGNIFGKSCTHGTTRIHSHF